MSREALGGRKDAGPEAPPPDGGGARATPWPVEPFPSAPSPAENPTTAEKAALGRLLFYDPVVSVDRQVACATCHSEVWGMSDGLPRSIGHGAGLLAGPGRSGDNVTRRNAPTLWNVAFRSSMFWDGRAPALEDQVALPFAAHEELDRPLTDVIADLRGIPAYADAFAGAFPEEPEPLTETTFARAIAAFERTLLTDRGLYDAYVAGDEGAMSASMLRGMSLFSEQGCASCHVPPLFSSERFEDRGVAAVPGAPEDLGRYEVTHDEADRGRFKVPTLRNAHETAPYFHTGGVATIEGAVAQEVDFSVANEGKRPLADDELADLTAFINKGLFDTKDGPTRPREVPSGLPLPIDGFSIKR